MWPFRSKKLRSYLINDKYKIILAFEHGGHKYYQFESAFEFSTGRGLQALTFYEEFSMRVDRAYLEKHIKAIDILLNNPKTIKISPIIEIHNNLKERLTLAPFPDHIYKLASVIFWDETESPFRYDYEYNAKKIAAWRADPDMLPFLVKVPLKELMPFGNTPDESLRTYFQVLEKLDKTIHTEKISEILYKHR